MTHVDGQLTLRYCVSGILSRNTLQRSVCRNQHTVDSQQQGESWGKAISKACVQIWALLLEAGWLASFPTTALWLLECTAQIPLWARRTYSPSCWKCCQLTAESLSRNCLLLKRASSHRALWDRPCPPWTSHKQYLVEGVKVRVVWRPGPFTFPLTLLQLKIPLKGHPSNKASYRVGWSPSWDGFAVQLFPLLNTTSFPSQPRVLLTRIYPHKWAQECPSQNLLLG